MPLPGFHAALAAAAAVGAAVALALAPALASSPSPSVVTDFDFTDLESSAHAYWTRPLQDPFTRLLGAVESGEVALDTGSEKAFLADLLRALEIPTSSQLVVFSATSLQITRITPSNPRAIYFNEDVSVGYIPGGRIEVLSVDPEIGGVFYIFDIPTDRRPLQAERSNRCMNCHAATETRDVPGFSVKSVIRGPNGGSLDAFRAGDSGHHIPLEERFGGWHVTGAQILRGGHANRVGRFVGGKIETTEIAFGEDSDRGRYLAETSDILPHLIHEHQAGFTNRCLETAYLERALASRSGGILSSEDERALDAQAAMLARYTLFAGEAALPSGGIDGDPHYADAFSAKRIPDTAGRSLRDFDLRDRLFRYRCSYMIYSDVFQKGLSAGMKGRVYRKIGDALGNNAAREFAHIPPDERRTIKTILRETLPDR